MFVFWFTTSLTKRFCQKSFKGIENWKKVFITQSGVSDPESFPFVVLGNKCDLEVISKECQSS